MYEICTTLLHNGWMTFDYLVCESKFEHLLTPNEPIKIGDSSLLGPPDISAFVGGPPKDSDDQGRAGGAPPHDRHNQCEFKPQCLTQAFRPPLLS